jgi:hypothetical protein
VKKLQKDALLLERVLIEKFWGRFMREYTSKPKLCQWAKFPIPPYLLVEITVTGLSIPPASS